MKIDVERLIDLVEDENDAAYDYQIRSKTLYKGDWSDLDKLDDRQKALEYARHRYNLAEDATRAVIEVFGLDKDQVTHLYIAARAVKKWRKMTNWQRLLPAEMKRQIMQFIFGPPDTPYYEHRIYECWMVWL